MVRPTAQERSLAQVIQSFVLTNLQLLHSHDVLHLPHVLVPGL